MIYLTQQELSNQSLQKQKDGEGSLVRSRMAGCGSTPSSFTKGRSGKLQKKRRLSGQPLCKNLREQNPADPSSNLGPRSSFFKIIQLISQESFTQKQLVEKTGLTDRAVRYALSKLLKAKIISQRVSLLDARQKIYELIK